MSNASDRPDEVQSETRDLARRFALLLEYDGTRFAGSQLQSNARTVQGVLEDAVERVTREQSRVAFAGRTDAGVHARGQVACFSNATRLDPATLQRALNACLPEDVAVLALVEAAPDFDPRRRAWSRHYRYLIDTRPPRSALDRERAWHVPGKLDLEAMGRAARDLEGERDFAAFAGPLERKGASTVRRLLRFEVTASDGRLACDAVADAFLRHQVRRMVGALVEVGRGRLTPEGYAGLLAGPPASAGPSAPPHGLYLMRVEYVPPLFEDAATP
jgi:tRNA pseudouridine38-40 synthase